MIRFIFAVFAIFGIVFGEDIDINSLEDLSKYAPKNNTHKERDNSRIQLKMSQKEVMNKGSLTIDDLKALAPTNEVDLSVSDREIYQEVKINKLTLRTENIPDKIYMDQIYKVDVFVNIGQKITVTPELKVDKSSCLSWVNENDLVWIEGDEAFETTLWFEPNNAECKINEIFLTLNRNGEFFAQTSVKPKNPKILSIQKRQNFASISADELVVKDYKTSIFDDTSNLITVHLAAKNANLRSFMVDNPSITKQGVDSVKGNYSSQSGYYFAVIDKNVTNLDFSYFNLKSKKFENFGLDINPQADDLSTQIGLNPKESKFEAYKLIAIYTLAAILLIMFLASKNITPLVFALLVLAFSVYMQKPSDTAIVAKNSAIRILPIKNSTVFYITQADEKVEIFAQNNGYYKILLPSGKIGWIKKDEISKN